MTSDIRSEDMELRAFSEELPYPTGDRLFFAEAASYAGLDMGVYPGDQVMEAYKSARFSVICLYLANKPGRIHGGGNKKWIAAASGLASKGWGLAPTYLGAQASLGGSWTPVHPLDEAQTDATEAVTLAGSAGLTEGQTLFLDVEAPFAPQSAQESYVLKWIESVQAKKFKAALYCFPHQIEWAKEHGVKIWTVHLNSHTGKKDRKTGKITWCQLTSPLPADPIDPGAIGTQGRFYCQAAGRSEEIDYDRWLVPDPSKM